MDCRKLIFEIENFALSFSKYLNVNESLLLNFRNVYLLSTLDDPLPNVIFERK